MTTNFCSLIFLGAYSLSCAIETEERQAMCHQTLPQFAQSAQPVTAKVEEAFEEAYHSVQLHFIAKIVKYGRQWIKSDSDVELTNKFLTAR